MNDLDFPTVVGYDSPFARTIREVLNTTSERELCEMYGCSLSTVKRWASGYSAPHPAMIPVVLRRLGYPELAEVYQVHES